MENKHIMWFNYTSRVDIDTGMTLTKHEAETQYTKIKTIKIIQYNANKTKGYISRTIEYRSRAITELPFPE